MPTAKAQPESEVLRRMTVRLIGEGERERFDLWLEQEHSLHGARLGGQILRYVAEVDGVWVALISFHISLESRIGPENNRRWNSLWRAQISSGTWS